MKDWWAIGTELYEKGVPIVAIVAVMLLVYVLMFPEKAEKVGLWLKTPFFKLFKWCGRSYVSSAVGTSVSDFLNKELLKRFDHASFSKVKVKFNLIRSTEEVNLLQNTMIIRLNTSNDQTRNKLAAASLAIPKVVCPYIRSNLDKEVNKAIDLAVLRKFADRLGHDGSLFYKENFLDPEVLSNPTVSELVAKLNRIDKTGYFISIFANELNYVGKGIYGRSDITNKTADVVGFLNYLLAIAEREEGDDTELSYRSTSINVNILLLARLDKVHQFGAEPYRQRLKRNFREGSESTYIVAFSHSWEFLVDVLKAISVDQRFSIINTYDLGRKNLPSNYEKVRISLVRANETFSDTTFSEHLEEIGLRVGDRLPGTITHLSTQNAVISISGLNAFIKKEECDWFALESCSEEFIEGDEYDFQIKDIVLSTGSIELTRRFPENDPWKDVRVPEVGDIVEVNIIDDLGIFLTARTNEGLEVRIPNVELCWGEDSMEDVTNLLGSTTKVVIVAQQPQNRLLRGSLKRLPAKSWGEVRDRFPKGAETLGTVIATNPQYATFELAPGFTGRVSKESFLEAGNEFQDFQNNFPIGTKLEVVVQKVWTGRKKISLELKRNLMKRALPAREPIDPVEHKIVRMPNRVRRRKD